MVIGHVLQQFFWSCTIGTTVLIDMFSAHGYVQCTFGTAIMNYTAIKSVTIKTYIKFNRSLIFSIFFNNFTNGSNVFWIIKKRNQSSSTFRDYASRRLYVFYFYRHDQNSVRSMTFVLSGKVNHPIIKFIENSKIMLIIKTSVTSF